MTSWTAADLPSFAGRTAIVTGANSGLGEVAARELARVGAQVILAVRNTGKLCEAAICYTGDILDPSRTKYTLAYYLQLAKELEKAGATLLAIKAMAGKGGSVEKTPFKSPIEDYYLTNPIARASAVMAECSRLASGQILTAAE